jgi:hypothetical protein
MTSSVVQARIFPSFIATEITAPSFALVCNEMPFSRHRIISAGVKGVAFEDAFQRHPAALEHTITGNRRQTILGASGVKATGGRFQRRDKPTVKTNQ